VIADETKGKFSILIISPTRIQSRDIARALINKGFQNVEYVEKGKPEVALIDGLLVLLDDQIDNLGWRITSRLLLPDSEFEKLLKKSYDDPSLKLSEMINSDCKRETLDLLDTLQRIKGGRTIPKDKLENFLIKIGMDGQDMTKKYLKNKLFPINSGDPAVRKIPIRATTIQSSKGLSDEYVFITHFDDKYFIKDRETTKPTDHEICNFLVALTRTKKRVYLISSNIRNQPTFLKWIKPERIKELE